MPPAAIALDVMGGDRGAAEIVAGGVQAAREDGADVILVGRKSVIEPELSRLGANVPIVDAPDVIEMDESPLAAVRAKPDSSLVVTIGLIRSGRANGFVSPANSGALVAAAVTGMRRIRGVERPAMATLFPTHRGHCLLVDVGANADSKPEHMLQFGVMGATYLELVLGRPRPRVGILSNGSEEGKGTVVVREAYELLRNSGLEFVGNLEGKDIYGHVADVVVMDGFVGNVTLKVAEATQEFVKDVLRAEATKTPLGILAGLLLKPTLRRIARRTDWQEFGGAPLLGIQGVGAKAHGRSDARAIRNAVRVARHAVEVGLPDAIRRAIDSSAPAAVSQAAGGA